MVESIDMLCVAEPSDDGTAIRHTWTNFCGCKTLDQINRNNCRNVLPDTWWRTFNCTTTNPSGIRVNLFSKKWSKENNRKCQSNASSSTKDGWIGGQWQWRARCICLIETKRGHIKFYWWQYDKQANATWLKYIHTTAIHCMGVCVLVLYITHWNWKYIQVTMARSI